MLGAHDVVRAAVRLTGDDGDLADRRLAVRVEQLRAAADDAVVLLLGAGQEARDVDEGDDRDVEGVAGAHEAGGLLGGVDVEAAGELGRLVGDDADAAAVDATEADDDVLGALGLDLEELVVVEERRITSCMSYGWFAESGMSVSSSRSSSVRESSIEPAIGSVGDRDAGAAPGCCSAGSDSRSLT